MADHKVSVAITSSLLVFSLLGFRHVGCQQSNFRVFRTVTELREFEQLSDRERLDSALLFPATGILEITGANQAATVQDAVALNIDCLPWLRRFPGGSIQWFSIQLDEFGHISDPMPRPENPTPPGTVARITVGGEFNRWLNISRIELVGAAEDPDSKIFQCEVCIAPGTPFEQCHRANYTNRVIGGPPVINTTGINECRQGENPAMPGDDVAVTERFVCPVISETPPRPIPLPTLTWFRDGVPAASATMGESFTVNPAFLLANPILNMGVFSFTPFFVLQSNADLVFTTAIANITNPMMGGLQPDATVRQARAILFDILLANWTCVANNTLGLSSVSNFLRMCGNSPVIPDCAAADGSRVLFLNDGDVAPPGCDICIFPGTSVTLNCMDSAGTPPVSYSWIINGVEVSQNPNLTVREPGNYSCTATNMDNAPVVEASVLFFSPRATLTSRIVGRTTDGCDRVRVNDTELESIRKEIDICICVDETLVLECTSDDPDAQLALKSEDAIVYENGTVRIMVTLGNLDTANQTFMCAITSVPGPCGGFVFQSHITVYGNEWNRIDDGAGLHLQSVSRNGLSPIDVSVQITTSGGMVLGQSGYSLICDVAIIGIENPSIIYQWTKSNGTQTQVGTDRILSFSPLRLSDAGRYTCRATVSSSCNITKMDTQDVTLQTVPVAGCPHEIDTTWGIAWPSAPRGSISVQICPESLNSIGNATRFCGSDSNWGEVNVLNCTSREFVQLEEMLANITFSNLEPEEQISAAAEATQQLLQATKPRNNSLLPQDLGASARILTVVIDILENNSASDNDVIEIFNNVLDDSNREGWRNLQSAGLMMSSELLLSSAERFAAVTATSANISGEQTLRQSRLNIVIVGEQYETPPNVDLQFPIADDLINYTQSDNISTIKIPPAVIRERLNMAENDGKVPVVFLLLRNLPMGFSTVNASTTTCTGREVRTQGATDVLSAQVGSRSENDNGLESLLYTPIDLNFTFVTNINSTLEAYRCVYWNFSEPIGNGSWITAGITTNDVVTKGNLTIVICQSTHLTSFAVLVDVVGGLADIDIAERIALQAVSYVGCTISIVCLIATVIFFLWLNYDQRRLPDSKRVKSVQNFVHLNFSLSLLLALTVFVVGIETATGNVFSCALVASLLHYLFLCTFCWMLCEGIMLYLLLRVVFSEMSKKWWPFVLIGYLTPLPIVAISVGIRYEYYGVKDSCGNLLYCWMSVDKGTIFGFVAPMLVIISINTVFMALALQTLWRVKKCQQQNKNERKFQDSRRLGRALLLASLILLPLLGLTWAFGTLIVNANSTVVAWLFTIFNSLQGMFIFFFHVVRNDKIWNKISPKLYSLRTKLTSISGHGTRLSSDRVGTLSSTNTTNKSSGTESKEKFELAQSQSTMDSPSTIDPKPDHDPVLVSDHGSKLHEAETETKTDLDMERKN